MPTKHYCNMSEKQLAKEGNIYKGVPHHSNSQPSEDRIIDKNFASLLLDYDLTYQFTKHAKIKRAYQEAIFTQFYLNPDLLTSKYLLDVFILCLKNYCNKPYYSTGDHTPDILNPDERSHITAKALEKKLEINSLVAKEKSRVMHEENQSFLQQYSHNIKWKHKKKNKGADDSNFEDGITNDIYHTSLSDRPINLSIFRTLPSCKKAKQLPFGVNTVAFCIDADTHNRATGYGYFGQSIRKLIQEHDPSSIDNPHSSMWKPSSSSDVLVDDSYSSLIILMHTSNVNSYFLVKRGLIPNGSPHPANLKKKRPIDIERKITTLSKRGDTEAAANLYAMWASMRKDNPQKRPLSPFSSLAK